MQCRIYVFFTIRDTGVEILFHTQLALSYIVFEDDFLLVRQIQVAKPKAWRKLLCSPWQIQRLTFEWCWRHKAIFWEACCPRLLKCSFTRVLLLFCIFWGYSSWSLSGPSSFGLLLVDLKNYVRLCWLVISWPSIFSGVTVSNGSIEYRGCARSKYRKPDWNDFDWLLLWW